MGRYSRTRSAIVKSSFVKKPNLPVNKLFFRQIDEIEENTSTVKSCKKTIKLNLPMQNKECFNLIFIFWTNI